MVTKRLLIFTSILLQVSLSISVPPADHLVPPPVPASQPQNHQLYQQQQQQQQQRYVTPPAPRGPSTEPPGFMSRIARWFGFGPETVRNQLQPQQQTPKSYPSPKPLQQQVHQIQPTAQQSQQAYQYVAPKPPCNMCNKFPWIPVFPGAVQYPAFNSYQKDAHNKFNAYPITNFIQHQQQSLPTYPPLNQPQSSNYAPSYPVQRAVKFNFPVVNNVPHSGRQYSPPPASLSLYAPVPLPNLSSAQLPPIYNPAPFRPVSSQPTLKTEAPVFQHVESPSEPLPTQIPPNEVNNILESSPDFEIIKSHPVTDFISSVEYTADIVQSPVIDISQLPKENAIDSDVPQLTALGSYDATGAPQAHFSTYQTTAPPPAEGYNHRHRAISQPTQFVYHSSPSPVVEHFYHTTPGPLFQPQESVVVHNHNEPDNYPAASSLNYTVHNVHNNVEVNDEFRPTLSPTEIPDTTFVTNVQPLYPTERPAQETTVDIRPQTVSSQRPNTKRNRETPKRLLDAPILYIQGGSSPRPFTRDPSKLNVRSSTYQNSIWEDGSPTPTPWMKAAAPTPTSSYSAIDASGHFAGISPPNHFQPPAFESERLEKRPKQVQQIIIPYTTKTKPRPFQLAGSPPADSSAQRNDSRYVNWVHSPDVELHVQQESKLVSATQPPARKTTKYLTKILATNLRELLRREHEFRNKSRPVGFDLSLLQKNIDDWTEQEFTSLSHKASTVSIHGRSKHIPTEYLTTTPSMARQSDDIVTTKRPTTEQVQVREYLTDRGSKRYEYFPNIIEHNRIESGEPETTPSTTTTTTTPKSVSPFYVRTNPPTPEPWQKAKVSISPLTKEKVYVVTPQPSFNHKITVDNVGTFKSPRFLVRPTPASAANSNHKSSSSTQPPQTLFTPELFGLMGLSAYIPAAPVETVAGHSKVITVVTPSSNKKRSAEEDEDAQPNINDASHS